MIRHGWKLKKLGSAKAPGAKVKIPKTQESIEIRIRDADGKTLFKWDPAKGNLKQGLYECLDYTQKGLGINLDDVIEAPKESPIIKEKIAEMNNTTRGALERLNRSTQKS